MFYLFVFVLSVRAGLNNGAVSGCSGLTSITIPFVGGSKKKGNDTYQYPFGYIFGTSGFKGASAVEQEYYDRSTDDPTFRTFYIPNSLKKATVTGGQILYGAFCNCTSLESITILPDSTTWIRHSAFSGCSGLQSVTIGSGAAGIDYCAFLGCMSLTEIHYNGTIDAWKLVEKANSWASNTGDYTIYCMDGTITKDGKVTYYNNAQSVSAYAAIAPRKREF